VSHLRRLTRLETVDTLIRAAPAPAARPALRSRLYAGIVTQTARREVRAPVPERSEHPVHMPTSNPPARRLAAWLTSAAAVIVVALLAGILLTAHQPGTPASTPTSQQTASPNASQPRASSCAPAQITASVPAGAYLMDLSMVSPDEGWAVGGVVGTVGGWGGSVLLHYHNCQWTPVGPSYDAALLSISMDSSSDGWAVGGASDGTIQKLALHYTNGRWQQVTLPDAADTTTVYQAVRMLSPTEGWITVTHSKDAQGNLRNTLLHLHGGTWTALKAPFAIITAVAPVGPDDAWMAGYLTDGQQGPVVGHYQAGHWTTTALPAGFQPSTLRMLSPTDGWLSGSFAAASNWEGDQHAAALHYDGSEWQLTTTGLDSHAQFVDYFAQSDALAFTVETLPQPQQSTLAIKTVQIESGGRWQTTGWRFQDIGWMRYLNQVAPSEYWAVGTLGGEYSGSTVLLYYADGAWHRYGG
jgi:hypothetical protein